MVAIVRTEWSGTSGGPGLTQMALLGAAGGEWNPSATQAAVNAVRAFWDGQKANLPDELKLNVLPVIDVYDTVSGDLTASYVAGTVPVTVQGTGAGGYAGGVGVKLTWNTGQIRNGRRVRGSTFIVPIISGLFSTTGTVTGAVQTTISTAGQSLISALNAAGTPLAVWSRPFNGPNPRVGFATEVIQGVCSSKSAILRGRRD
jgi:hypothetical protein